MNRKGRTCRLSLERLQCSPSQKKSTNEIHVVSKPTFFSGYQRRLVKTTSKSGLTYLVIFVVVFRLGWCWYMWHRWTTHDAIHTTGQTCLQEMITSSASQREMYRTL